MDETYPERCGSEGEKLHNDEPQRVSQKEPDVKDSFLPDTEKGKDVGFRDKPRTNCWCVAAYLLILFNIGCLLTTLTVTVIWHIERKNSLEGEKSESDICLQCEKLSLNWQEDKDIFTIRNGTCCGKTSNHLDKLIKKHLESKRPLQRYRYTSYGCQKNKIEKPAVRVVGIVHEENDPLLWNKESALSYNKGGLFYAAGHLHVNETGFYYIYSQVVFVGETNQTGTLHSLHKRSLKQTSHEKLLEGTHSSCQTHAGQTERTSFVGAVFRFEAGDKIMTQIGQKTRLTNTDHHHHFGMYMI